MMKIEQLYLSVLREVFRILTGKLFTEEQIQSITTHTIGRHFSEFFPVQQRDVDARERVAEARHHITQASNIISEMQANLSSQSEQLDSLLTEIEEKNELAAKYRILAETDQERFSLLRGEMENALREELIAQSDKGRRFRQFASVSVGLLTLVVGAALGAYFKDLIHWLVHRHRRMIHPISLLVSVRKEVDSLESFVILWWPPIRFSGGGRCGRARTGVSTSARALAIRAI